MVNDFGVIVNPLLVTGQAHGGVVQGIGQALMERTVFDEEGQFLTGSLTDYALPRASDAVTFRVHSRPVPAKTNPLGVKGCGEAGCAGSLPAVVNLSSMRYQNMASDTSICRRPRTRSGKRSGKRNRPFNDEGWGLVPLFWRYSRQTGRRPCRREQRSVQNRRCRATLRLWHTRP